MHLVTDELLRSRLRVRAGDFTYKSYSPEILSEHRERSRLRSRASCPASICPLENGFSASVVLQEQPRHTTAVNMLERRQLACFNLFNDVLDSRLRGHIGFDRSNSILRPYMLE